MRRTCRLSLGTFLFLCIGTAPAVAAPLYALSTLIPVPASAENSVDGAFAAYDISFFDPLPQLDYVADRSNASVDIFSSASNTFVGRIGGTGQLFSGQTQSNATSGPDGVVVVNLPGQHQVWAAARDGDMQAVFIRGLFNSSFPERKLKW
jgi:hypothetical protein